MSSQKFCFGRKEWIIFGAAFSLGIAFILLMHLKGSEAFKKIVLAGDASDYYTLGLNLKTFFTLSIDQIPRLEGAFLRTPGYPLFLALIFSLTAGSIMAVLIVQVMLSAFSAVLIYRIADLFRFPKLVGLGAGLFFALEPSIAVFAVSILTETVFVFLFLLFVYLLATSLINNDFSKKKYLVLGLILGFDVLVRPVLYPFIFVIILASIFCLIKKIKPKESFKIILALIAGVYLMISPWLLRNKIVFDTWSVSSISGVHTFLSYAVPFYAYQHGVNKNLAEVELMEKIKPLTIGDKYDLRNNAVYKKFAREIITADIPGYFFFHVINTTSFFLSNGYRNIPRDLGFDSVYPSVNLSTIRLLINRQFGVLLDFFKSHPVSLLVFVVGVALWFLINLFMLYGIFVGIFRESDEMKRYFIIFCCMAIFYFAVVAGPEAYYKMRFPVNPFIFILAFYGLSYPLKRFSNHANR